MSCHVLGRLRCCVATPCNEWKCSIQIDLSPSSDKVIRKASGFGLFSEDSFFSEFFMSKLHRSSEQLTFYFGDMWIEHPGPKFHLSRFIFSVTSNNITHKLVNHTAKSLEHVHFGTARILQSAIGWILLKRYMIVSKGYGSDEIFGLPHQFGSFQAP